MSTPLAIHDFTTSNLPAALEFLNWFSEPEQQVRWISEAGSLPLTTDISDAPGFAKYEKSLPGLDKFIANTKLAQTRPTIPQYPQISQAMGEAVASVLYGKAEPAEALQQAVDASNAELQAPGP